MRPLPLLVCFVLLCRVAFGGLVRIEVTERSDVVPSPAAKDAPPYERIVGKAYFAVDPKLPVNRVISDLDFAPRNAAGLVEFSSDLYILQPKDPKRGNGTAFFQVGNRGRKDLLMLFNLGTTTNDPRTLEEIGDGFLFAQGFTLVWLGWQWDTPNQDKLLTHTAPVARNGSQPIRGLVRADFVPDERTTQIYVADRNHIAYRIANPDDPNMVLTVRDRRDSARRTIPRAEWQIDAKRENVILPAGFEPGRIYELVYTAEDPVLVGLGSAAIRDLISHLKQERATTGIQRAIAMGSSQSGRFLRTFLYFGFNEDEKGARVFDGVWAHVAGAGRGSFNHRFAQPSRDARPFFNFFYPTDLFPFTDAAQSDLFTGQNEGLLDRATKSGTRPKIFYTNGAYEYYGRTASLIHTTVDGTKDFPPQPDTRIYFIPGSQHGPATAFPPVRAGTQNLANANDYRWALRSLLVGLNRWITDGAAPPASAYPTIASAQLVAPTAVKFPRLPGVQYPNRIHQAATLNYGPDFRSKGIVTVEPPAVGSSYPVLLPQVDADGNETSGIRMPWLQVPLATYTGWNLRAASIGAPAEMFSFAGSTIPLARNRNERAASGDPRPSIAERYPNREAYLAQVRAAVRNLAAERYVLASDSDAIVAHAGRLWDFWTGSR
jgi:hypothetical protein